MLNQQLLFEILWMFVLAAYAFFVFFLTKNSTIRLWGGEIQVMSFFLGRGEKVAREQTGVLYHHGYSRIGSIMWGKLILTNKRFLFLEQRSVKSGGFFGFGKKTEVQTAGVKMNLPIDSVIGATVETRTRKKGTLNQPYTAD